MALTWLPDVLSAEGLVVRVLDGWAARGRSGGINPQGVVVHHTVTSVAASDETVARLLRDGRSDLPGPLAQLGLQRDGTFVVVAAGRANHNGYGLWGNDSIGIEAYNNGVDEPWPTVQMEAWVKGCAAICRYMGWDETHVKAHRETDPKRKIDPHSIDMNEFRFWVALNILNPPVKPGGPPMPSPSLLPVLGQGSRGGAVTSLQLLLRGKAAQPIEADGVFGLLTGNAVKNVQHFFGLPQTGIVDETTWGVLFL